MIKICKYCKVKFDGRANQLYHPKCKVEYNNFEGKLKREFLLGIFRPHYMNSQILNRLNLSVENSTVPIDILISLGFDFKAVTGFEYIGDEIVFHLFDYRFKSADKDSFYFFWVDL
jgi:hypothetical protein